MKSCVFFKEWKGCFKMPNDQWWLVKSTMSHDFNFACFTLSICAPCFLKGGMHGLWIFAPRWINICLRSKPIFVSLSDRKFEVPSCSEVDSAAKMSNCRHFHAPVKVVCLSTNAKSTLVLEIQWMTILRLKEGRSCGNIPSQNFGNPDIQILDIQTSKEWQYCIWMKGWNCKDIPILALKLSDLVDLAEAGEYDWGY